MAGSTCWTANSPLNNVCTLGRAAVSSVVALRSLANICLRFIAVVVVVVVHTNMHYISLFSKRYPSTLRKPSSVCFVFLAILEKTANKHKKTGFPFEGIEMDAAVEKLWSIGKEKEGEGERPWTFVDRKGNVSISRKAKAADEAVSAFRGQGLIAFPPSVLADTILDVKTMREWNPQLHYVNVLTTLDDDTLMVHKVFKAKKCMMELHRDFVYAERLIRRDDGTILILAWSEPAEEWAKNVPVPQKCVRGTVYPSGWILEPWALAGGKMGTNVTYVTMADLKSLPDAVQEIAGREQPLIVR